MESRTVVVSLFEGDYVLGLGALINSLERFGFKGLVVAGFRGKLTGWAEAATPCQGGFELRISPQVLIRFVPIEPGWHMANLKPWFMLETLEKHAPEAETVFYFDPDIVIKCDWSFFERWASYGVAMCQEIVMSHSSPDHPMWIGWKNWAEAQGFELAREAGQPLNSGCVGVQRSQKDALALWHRLIDLAANESSLDRFAPSARPELFVWPDQDAFNIVSLVYSGPISRIGPEGMDFVGAGYTMSHAAGGSKPWRKRFIRSALAGIGPVLPDKCWAENLERPIQVLPESRVRKIGREIKIASLIGRFIRKGS